MRQNYHIIVDQSNKDEVERACIGIQRLPTQTENIFTATGELVNRYLIDLSKYELLYVRLVCQHGKIYELDPA